jgi:hypothetical protein
MKKEEKTFMANYIKSNIKRPDDWVSPPYVDFRPTRTYTRKYILKILQTHIDNNSQESKKIQAIKEYYETKGWKTISDIIAKIDDDNTINIERLLLGNKIFQPSERVIKLVMGLFDISPPDSSVIKRINKKLEKNQLKSYLKQSDLPASVASLGAFKKVVNNISNSRDIKIEIYKILKNLYDELLINKDTESVVDLYAFNSTGQKIEIACCVLDFDNKPFNASHQVICQQVIKEIKKIEQKISKFLIICNTKPSTIEYQEILMEVRNLAKDNVVGESNFYNISSFINNEIVQVLAFDLKFLIMSSNTFYRDKFNEQLNQAFYLEDVPFSTEQIKNIQQNPIKYLINRSSNNDDEVQQKIEAKKHWNFIIGEFGFGKTSLLLKLTSLINQEKLEFLFMPISLFSLINS